MASAEKVMCLGLRKMQIEESLKEVKVIVEAFKVVENHWDEFDESLSHDFEETARKYDIEVEKLTKSLKEAEAEWLEASEEYKREKGVEA